MIVLSVIWIGFAPEANQKLQSIASQKNKKKLSYVKFATILILITGDACMMY